jgi:hypothetical protein
VFISSRLAIVTAGFFARAECVNVDNLIYRAGLEEVIWIRWSSSLLMMKQ